MSQLAFPNALESKPEFQKQVQDMVRLVDDANNDIREVRSSLNSAAVDDARVWLESAAKYRGRELFYPYVGSGRGRGAYVELVDGSVKMDLINGIGIHILGHSHQRVIASSLMGAVQDVVMQGNLQPNREYVEISQKLVDIASRGSRLKYAWLSTCGAMANENALKACRQKTNGARMIVAMHSAFAGRSTMMAEITDNPTMREGLPNYHEVLRLKFFDKNNPNSIDETRQAFEAMVEQHRGNICCFTFEPMQGEGGYNVAPREYFLPLLEICRRENIPVWADEVQTFCRTGQFFAFQTLDFGDYVDVATVAKTLQNGATFFTEELNPRPGLIAGTFSGSSAALRAGLAILDELDTNGFMGPDGKIQKIHREFVDMLNELNDGSLKGQLRDAGGLGLMIGVTPFDGSGDKRNALLKKLFDKGLMTFGCGKVPARLRFLLPAVLTSQDIRRAGELIESAMLEML